MGPPRMKNLFCLLLLILSASSSSSSYSDAEERLERGGGGEEKLMVVVAETPNDDDDDDDDDDNEVAEASNPKLERRAGLYPEGAASGPDRSEGRQGDGTRSASQLVSDIHCLKTTSSETFTAFLRLPGGFAAAPVLEEGSGADAEGDCLITETNVEGIYALDLSLLSACGVRECEEQLGKDVKWLCVLLRFPVMSGLKLPEDEVVEIKCKPQDSLVQGRNAINFQENTAEQRSPTIYLGGGQNFLSEIGLFRRLGGTELFASRVHSGSTIELGEYVQLRSIVRAGDGWNYAKISDVVVHRVRADGVTMSDAASTARLVLPDGCRNPAYRVLAPRNPWRDDDNRLIVNFDFRAFMFQEMESGDAIVITANVVACVEEIDCAPVRCDDRDAGHGYGRRKRRSISGPTTNSSSGSTRQWEENLELKIRLPQDLILDGRSGEAPSPTSLYQGLIPGKNFTESECKLYLIVTLSVALVFSVLSAFIVLVACIRRFQEVKKREKYRRQQEEEDQKKEKQQEGDEEEDAAKMTTYLTQQYVQSLQQQQQQRQILARNASVGMSTNKPVTVRSVKRRDKAKLEERQHQMMLQQDKSANKDRREEEEQAVMV